jgi:hypothetical protein
VIRRLESPDRGTVLCLLATAALAAALSGTLTAGTLGHRGPLLFWYPLDAVLFVLAVLALRSVPDRRVGPLILSGGVLLGATGLVAPPRTSDDAYRYGWDGAVQAAGVSPYAHPPLAPQLARLREAGLFPHLGPVGCRGWDLHFAAGVCTHINRPEVHTIYPPVSELYFLALHPLAVPLGIRAFQIGGLLLVTATTAVLLRILRRRGLPLRRAALWAWFPGTVLWAVNDAHVDTLGVLLTVGALGALGVPDCSSRRRVVAGAALGLATATKLLPALVLPAAVGRPRRPTAVLAALGAFALVYVPYVVASGTGVLGYLPGYLREEGYDQAQPTRFGLLRLVLPAPLAPWAGAVVLLAAVCWVLLRSRQDEPWRGALVLYGTALFVAAPGYPWYALMVVALVALSGRWEWLALPAATGALYLIASGTQRPAYSAALGLLLVVAGLRRPRVRRPGFRRRRRENQGRGELRAQPPTDPQTTYQRQVTDLGR